MKEIRDLYIFGSGDLARELASSVVNKELLSSEGVFAVKAFIDINNESSEVDGIPVIYENTIPQMDKKEVSFVIGLTQPQIRKKIIDQYSDYHFPSFVHRTCSLSYQETKPGKGNVFTANTYISINVDLGAFNFFNWNTTVGHDAIIGKGNVFNPGTRISGGVKIGDFNFFGGNSMILENKSIGHSNIIGACAFLNQDISDGGKWVGIPAHDLNNE